MTLEDQILNQIRVLSAGMMLPLWIANNTCVHIRVDATTPEVDAQTTAGILTTATEVIVAPRIRRPARAAEDDVPPQLSRLRLQRNVASCEQCRSKFHIQHPTDPTVAFVNFNLLPSAINLKVGKGLADSVV